MVFAFARALCGDRRVGLVTALALVAAGLTAAVWAHASDLGLALLVLGALSFSCSLSFLSVLFPFSDLLSLSLQFLFLHLHYTVFSYPLFFFVVFL